MLKLILTTAAIAVAAPAFAADICADHPKNEWMTKEAITAKVTAAGYEAKSVKPEDGCWEVKGFKDGKRVEAYFDPKSGDLVKTK